MRILKQLAIFFTLIFLCEVISLVMPSTFPSSVLSMLILFFLLFFKLIKLKDVEEVGIFLQKNMSLFYVPLAVSIIDEFKIFKDKIFIIVLVSFLSFLITFIITAYVSNIIIKIQNKIKKRRQENE